MIEPKSGEYKCLITCYARIKFDHNGDIDEIIEIFDEEINNVIDRMD